MSKKLFWENSYLTNCTATHIIYYFFIQKVGKHKIIGSNIAADKARIDFEYEKPMQELLPELEVAVNAFLAENHPIIRRPDEICYYQRAHRLWGGRYFSSSSFSRLMMFLNSNSLRSR